MDFIKTRFFIITFMAISLLGNNALCTYIDNKLEKPKVKTEVVLSDIDKTGFYKLISKETLKILESKKEQLSKEEITGIKKAKDKIIRVLQSLNFWDHFKHLMITHGKGVALTSIISEVVTVLILPPAFITMGWNTAAAIVGGVPSPTYMIPAYIGATKLRKKKIIGDELGFALRKILKLDKLRHELIGFSIDHRVMSIILKGLEKDEELTIIKRKFGRLRPAMHGKVIDVFELEDLVSVYIGKQKLARLKDFSTGDDAVYTSMLLLEIDRNYRLKLELNNLMHRKLINNDLNHLFSEHSLLFTIHEKLEVIKRYQLKVRRLKNIIDTELKIQGLNKKELNIVTEFIQNILLDLDILDHDIKVLEYRYIDYLSSGENISKMKFSNESRKLISRLDAIKKNIVENGHVPDSKKNINNANRLKTFLKKLDKFNDDFSPHFNKRMNKKSCKEILSKLNFFKNKDLN